MIIGKWNKSVILTYIGMAFAILGIFLSFMETSPLYPLSCLIIAGVCDLFDGFIARRMERTEDEKKFGVELDSLVDVISFIALPIAIAICVGLTKYYFVPIFIIFAICGIARLGHFNIATADEEKAIKYYQGLPVTYTALILPLAYLLTYVLTKEAFLIVYGLFMLAIAILNVLNIKIVKPRGIAYIFFALLAIIMLVLFLVVLWKSIIEKLKNI